MIECKQSHTHQFFQIQGQITPHVLVQFDHNQNHLRPYRHIYCGQVWYWLVNICRCYSVNSQIWQIFLSRADNSDSSGPISSIIELIRDLLVIYTLTKFGADWLIFVDARVLTRKLWTEGHRRTASDYDSSLSTLCSGELIKQHLILNPLPEDKF